MVDPARQDIVPMFNDIAIAMVHGGETRKLGCVVQPSWWEFMLVCGPKHVHGIARHMENQSPGEQHVNKAHIVVIRQHLVGESFRFHSRTRAIVILSFCLCLNHFPSLAHIQGDIIRKYLYSTLEVFDITRQAGRHNGVANVIQSAIEHRVLSGPHNGWMSIEDTLHQCRTATDKSNDKDRHAGVATDSIRPKGLMKHLLHGLHLALFQDLVIRCNERHFVLVSSRQMIPGLFPVLRFGIVIGEHDMVDASERLLEYLPGAPIGRLCHSFLVIINHVFQNRNHWTPALGDYLLLGNQDLGHARKGVAEKTVMIVLNDNGEICSGIRVLSKNDTGRATRPHGIQVHGFNVNAFGVCLYCHFKHVGHKVKLSHTGVQRT
mmetsp:Transcript_3984/g.9040  ORF Transcript_3984/g.9040 Transcript_3984/m.9040 type:complete len:377 (-) Transcript_3984:915-2045(-)